jgi:hypothetical protein
MTARHLKVLLDSLVWPEARKFEVQFGLRRTRRILGTYRRSARMITIIRKNNHGSLDIVATGLHELAHHMTWEKDQQEYHVTANGQQRRRSHGKNFFSNLHQLAHVFNTRYRKRLQGAMFCDLRCPAQSPFYMTPEECLLEIIFERRRFATNTDVLDLEPNSAAGPVE